MASGKTKEEVKEICAQLSPRPDVAPSVRKLPAPEPVALDVAHSFSPGLSTSSSGNAVPVVLRLDAAGSAPASRPVVEPLSPERYRLQFTVSKATREKLRRVQDLMRRQIPDGDPGVIFDRALDLLLAQAEKTAFSATRHPRRPRVTKRRSRTIPAAVERAVWERDGGRCAFVGPTGHRCSETTFLEFHHRKPHGHRGEATEENIALRCRAHNVHESDLVFGRFEVGADREWLPGGANLFWNR